MSLFGTKKSVNPRIRYPDAYYKQIFFDKQMFDGIALVAKIERTTKKKAARLLIERGFSSNMAEKLKTEMAIRELERKPHLTRFVLELRRFAKERGTHGPQRMLVAGSASWHSSDLDIGTTSLSRSPVEASNDQDGEGDGAADNHPKPEPMKTRAVP